MATGDCLVTVTTEDFLPGAVAMLGSFEKHHPRFEGDVIVLHDGLTGQSRRLLRAVCRRVQFQPISPVLLRQVERLAAAFPASEFPQLRIGPRMFYTLEAFRLGGYRKVLYYDSDMLFRSSIGELFGTREELVCCGDRYALEGRPVDAATFLPPREPAAPAGRSTLGERRGAAPETQRRATLKDTFNAGFLLIDGSLAGPRTHEDLMALVAPKAYWRRLEIRLADQPVLNRYFAGRQTLVSWTYNFFVPEARHIHAREGIDAGQAKVLHFKGSVKPWTPAAMLPWARGPGFWMAPAFKLWYEAYADVLARVGLRSEYRLRRRLEDRNAP